MGNPFGALSAAGLPSGEVAGASESAAEKESADGTGRSRGRVVLRREKSQRGGKTVVVAGDFAAGIPEDDLADLARRARQECGCGGALKDREIVLQGDDAPRVRAFFERAGFRVAGEGKAPVV